MRTPLLRPRLVVDVYHSMECTALARRAAGRAGRDGSVAAFLRVQTRRGSSGAGDEFLFKAKAPAIEVGIVSNHLSGSSIDYPSCDVQMFHESVPVPTSGFALNTESPDEEMSGNEGVFNTFERARLETGWRTYLGPSRIAMLFRSPFVEDVRGKQGTGPNMEMGGDGTGESDRGVRFYYRWVRENVGRWEYPRHVKG